LCYTSPLAGLARRGESDLWFRLLISAFIVLKSNLYYNQVTPPRHRILYDLEPDILIAECLIAPFIKRFSNIIIIISVVNIIPRLGLVIIKVFRVVY
jgi:hypothetical protein